MHTDLRCGECNGPFEIDEKFDAFYCPKCDEWFCIKCQDKNCSYCKDRPEKPSMRKEVMDKKIKKIGKDVEKIYRHPFISVVKFFLHWQIVKIFAGFFEKLLRILVSFQHHKGSAGVKRKFYGFRI